MNFPLSIQTTLLGSPFQEHTKTFSTNITKMTETFQDPYISFIDSSSTPPSTSSSSASSICSSSSHSIIQENVCFCGQPIGCEEEDEGGIYCSSECARQDAMAALTGGTAPFTMPIKTNETIHQEGVSEFDNESNISSFEKPLLHSSLALQKQTMTNFSHYRRMGALESLKDDYPIEAIEEAFLTPSSGSTSLYNLCNQELQQQYQEEIAGQLISHVRPSFALQRWMKENEIEMNDFVFSANLLEPDQKEDEHRKSIVRQSSEIDFFTTHQDDPIVPQQKQSFISLPSTPSLDSDEEIQIQRKRQDEIEKEIRQLDQELKEQLGEFDKNQKQVILEQEQHNKRDSTISFLMGGVEGDSAQIKALEDEIMMEFNSPNLDFEAPLGWRRGTKVYSTNFLGLQLDYNSPSPVRSSDGDSDRAIDDHSSPSPRLSKIQRLHAALGMSIVKEEEEEGEDDKQHSHRIPSALDMAKDLAIIQATWNARQHVRAMSNNSIGEMPTRKEEKNKKSSSFSDSKGNKILSQKRSLTNFFQRRPSHNEISSTTTNIQENQNVNNPISRLTKSASPRFAILTPGGPLRRGS